MKGIILQISVILLGTFLLLGTGGGGSGGTDPDTVTEPDTGITTLNTPTNTTAVSAYKGAVITWNAVTFADSYQVCSATESIADFSNCANYSDGILQTVSTNSAVFDSLTEGQLHYFSVIANTTSGISSSASANVSTTPSLGLNDTGASRCGSETANNLPCPVANHPNQDAENGLDAQATSNVDGDLGFNFTKLDSNGSPLANTENTWSCVKDNITGLIWEAKTSFNRADRFTWHNTDSATNAGSSGDENSGGASCTGYDASDSSSYCNTEAYVTRVNFGSYCGIANWRVPKRGELNSIVNYDVVEPTIDLAYFGHTDSELYWSGTPSFSSSTASNFVWATNFRYGGSAKQSKQDELRIRLVSDGQ